MGVAASLWAALLLPPQLVEWSPADTPEWIAHLATADVYEWLSSLGAAVGLTDPYFLFGAGVAPSFLLIGWCTCMRYGSWVGQGASSPG